MNSTNWPAPDVWVFTAQMVEHCSANAEAMGSNPIEVPKFWGGVYLQLDIKLQVPMRRSYCHLKFVLPQFTLSSKSSELSMSRNIRHVPTGPEHSFKHLSWL